MTRDSLGYGVAPADVWRVIARPLREGGVLAYPGYGRLRLFTMAELTTMLRDADLAPVRTWGLHALTNLIPSTVLHRARLPRPLAALYRRLCALDAERVLARAAPRQQYRRPRAEVSGARRLVNLARTSRRKSSRAAAA